MAKRLKDQFFQRSFLERLADEIGAVHPPFDRKRFIALVYDKTWSGLELKARMRHVSEALGRTLPPDYREAVGILLDVERHFAGFDHLVFADFVERFGVGDFEPSMKALEVFTRTSAEFAVRPFIRKDQDRAMAQMLAWASHDSEKVRRLASEGCRPRLPWGTALEELKRDPAPILPILERLKDDPSEHVRRSVANNLGDIAKDHPDLAVDVAARWIEESAARATWVKHALRGLLKKGNRRALGLFGIAASAGVASARVTVSPSHVALGGKARLRVLLQSNRRTPQHLRIEYAITYARPGGRTARKVFKVADIELAPGATADLGRSLNFADRTVRTHHPGRHVATLIVNGRPMAEARFTLTGAAGARPSPRSRRPTSKP
jgi:3-methyladenine DNA glycosylase AlkC